VPELAIALVAARELAIVLVVAGLVRQTVPEVELAIVPVVAELELIALAAAAAGNASVAAMFLGAAVPARAVPLAAEVAG